MSMIAGAALREGTPPRAAARGSSLRHLHRQKETSDRMPLLIFKMIGAGRAKRGRPLFYDDQGWPRKARPNSSLRSSTNCRALRCNHAVVSRAAVLSGTSTSKKRQVYTCLFLLVEMIRLELTTYTLRTYRSTG